MSPAPNMVSVIAKALVEHYDVELEHGYWSCICGAEFGVLLPDELHQDHQARAVMAAISGALGTDWGMRTPLGMHYDYASEEEARRLAGQNRCDVVTRLAAGPWERAE